MNKCKKCGHEWLSRVEEPIECPKCKSYKWNRAIEDKENKLKKDNKNG